MPRHAKVQLFRLLAPASALVVLFVLAGTATAGGSANRGHLPLNVRQALQFCSHYHQIRAATVRVHGFLVTRPRQEGVPQGAMFDKYKHVSSLPGVPWPPPRGLYVSIGLGRLGRYNRPFERWLTARGRLDCTAHIFYVSSWRLDRAGHLS